ncbi:MAG: glycosyl hydrolase [Lachnospiraceae bacterium]
MNDLFKKTTSLLLVSAIIFTGCGNKTNNGGEQVTTPTGSTQEPTVTVAPATSPTPTPNLSEKKPLDNVHGDIRTEYNENLDLSDYALTANDAPADFYLLLEAEDAKLTGNCTSYTDEKYSGGGYASGLTNSSNDNIIFHVEIENTGFYDLNFRCHSGDSGRVNNVAVDGVMSGSITCNSDGEIVDSYLLSLYLEAGSHDIAIVPSWGWTDFDCLIITRSDVITEDTYNVTADLCNPNADENTRRLYKFLCDIYGKYTLTGNFVSRGRISLEYSEIEAATGENFAVMGMEMGDYDLTSKANGSDGKNLGYTYDFYTNAGGIVQLCWHWHAPDAYVIDDPDNNHYWWNSFYKEHTTLNLDKIMNGEDEAGHQLLVEDMNNMATELERLRDAGVPVIWRPLHEASGGWFWWGDCEPESYKKLWIEMYDIFTNEHNLTNLIWMWNGQDADWYPGDEYVDIISYDIYQPEHTYTSYSGTFAEAASIAGESKLIALSENGVVPDPDNLMQDNARWLFWGTWGDPHTLDGLYLSETYTEKDMLIKAYSHDRTLTLSELPDLKTYPLD